jgi:2,4-dienoyl-CoA reductase-like NADH-dependent reductase (Old Yellow Enzyme family)
MSPFEALVLPNGSTLPNRIAKAAMEETWPMPGTPLRRR